MMTNTGATQNGRATTTDQLGTTTRPVKPTRTTVRVTACATSNLSATDSYVRDPSGTLVTWRTATTKRSYLTDRQGSVVVVVNTTDGTVDRRSTYDPYGPPPGPRTPSSTTPTPGATPAPTRTTPPACPSSGPGTTSPPTAGSPNPTHPAKKPR